MEKYKLQEYEPLWNNWYVDELIGEGSFGTVYRIKREEFGTTHYSALKILSIPKQESEVKDFYAEGMTQKDTQTYLRGVVEDIYNEIVLMAKLKGKSNIVSYEDHQIIENKEGLGYYILIRMELLKSLNDYVLEKDLTGEQVVKLGKDICQALILCERQNILHRDIKPDNIFVSEDGDFKLGDFGIAKKVEDYQMGMSIKGSFKYMAPEVYKGGEYDERVDIYSLGIVLYTYLNDKKIPFLEAGDGVITYSQRQEALRRRFHGEKIPRPRYGGDGLKDIILKAIEFYPEDRYHGAKDFLDALNTLGQKEMIYSIEKSEETSILKENEETVLLTGDNMGVDSTVVLSEDKIKEIQKEELKETKGLESKEAKTIKMKKKKQPLLKIFFGLIGGICLIGLMISLLFAKMKEEEKIRPEIPTKLPKKTSIIEKTKTPIPTQTPKPLKLIEVDVSNKNLNSLEGVKQLSGDNRIAVSVLNVSQNSIKDISSLEGATNLKSLDISFNKISNVSSLQKLHQLEILKLQSNKIKSVDWLVELVKMKHLDLSENVELKDIEKLKQMQQLEFLNLKGTKVNSKQVNQLKEEIPKCVVIDKDGSIHD